MLFMYWGHPIDQEEIVRRTWGRIVNMPAQPSSPVACADRWVDRPCDGVDRDILQPSAECAGSSNRRVGARSFSREGATAVECPGDDGYHAAGACARGVM